MKPCSAPSSLRNRIGSKHERSAERERSHVFAVVRCGSERRAGATDGFGRRTDERFARGGRPPGGIWRYGLRNQYGFRKTCFGAHLRGAGQAITSESGALALLRRRGAAD